MIDVNSLRKGTTFTLDNELFKVIEYQHHKPGRGKATIRTTIRNLRTGAIIQKNFISGDRVQDIRVEGRIVQYLYSDGEYWHFMDEATYEQVQADAMAVGDSSQWLKEQDTCNVILWDGVPISVEPPNFVNLTVTETDPGLKGDTAQGGVKPATLETGAVVRVPLFIEIGDLLKIDTRTGEYVSRAKE